MGPRLAEIYVVAIKNLDACRNCSSDFMAKFLVVLTDLSNRLQQPSGKGSSGGSGGSANSANANSSSRVEGTGLGAWVWVTGELQRTQELIDMKNNGDRLAYPLDQHPRTYTPLPPPPPPFCPLSPPSPSTTPSHPLPPPLSHYHPPSPTHSPPPPPSLASSPLFHHPHPLTPLTTTRFFRAASHTEAINAYSTAIHRIDPQVGYTPSQHILSTPSQHTLPTSSLKTPYQHPTTQPTT